MECYFPDATFPEEFLCTEELVLKLTSSLDVKKATGADEIPARMLKATAPSIISSVTKIFNLSLITGRFPAAWKFARIVPIPKAGDVTNPSNYRPISILPILSKLLERHVHNLLTHHLHTNCPLSPYQWGFTEGKSTTSALLSFTHDCHKALDSSKGVCTIFFDLSKAFDTVPHLPLLHKLFCLQIHSIDKASHLTASCA